jgi:hypothetical protein
MIRISLYIFTVVVLASVLLLCGSKVEVSALIWRLHSADLGASYKLQSLGIPARKEVQKYCHLLLFPALDDGTPGALSRFHALGETGRLALNNYFANTLSEIGIEIPDSSSPHFVQTLPRDVSHIFFLSKDGELEVSGESFEANAPSAQKAALFGDRETPFATLLVVLESLAKENTRTVYFAARAGNQFSFANVELTTPASLYTPLPNTLIALSDENSFFNHVRTQDKTEFLRAIDYAREDSPNPDFLVRFVVAENVHLETLFNLITFCLENRTRPLFKLLTDEDASILDKEAEHQGLKR